MSLLTIACIVQARLNSSRLPGKTMLMLPTGRTVIQEVMHRASKIKGVDNFAVAIPRGCEPLHNHIVSNSVVNGVAWSVIVGPEDDVLRRYHIAAWISNADHIMRITADCPCIDHTVCTQVLSMHIDGGYAYTSNVWPRTFPVGYDCEVFTWRVLDEANEKAASPVCREHVTPYFNGSFPEEQASNIRRGNVSQDVDESGIRLTLDTISDYVAISHHLMGGSA